MPSRRSQKVFSTSRWRRIRSRRRWRSFPPTRNSRATRPTVRARTRRRRSSRSSTTRLIRHRRRTSRRSCAPSRPPIRTSSTSTPTHPISLTARAMPTEIGFKPKMIGGGMVGLQATAIKTQLGPLLNGFTNYDFWLPVPKMQFPGVADLITRYQARAAAEGVDPLGYYMAPWGYAQLQVLQQAVEGTKSLDDAKLADYIRANSFKTVVGDVKFGAKGECAESRVLQVQFQNVQGNDVAQFKDISTQVVVGPSEYESGKVIYPYENAK